MANPLTLNLVCDNPNFTIEVWKFDNYSKPIEKVANYPYVIGTPLVIADLPVNSGVNGVTNRLCFFPTNGATVDKIVTDARATQIGYVHIFQYPKKINNGIVYELNQANYNNLLNKTVTITLTVIGGVSTVSPFSESYYLAGNTLKKFADVKFIEYSQDGSIIINNSQFVNNMLVIPFKIKKENYPDSVNIKLGSKDTGVLAPLLNTDLIAFDLGNIIINDLKNSVLDFEGVNYELKIPYIDDVLEIPPSLINGKTINIQCILDIYTGECSINLYNGGDIPFISFKNKLGRNIPIKMTDDIIGNLSPSNNIENSLTQAMITKQYPELVSSNFSNLVSKVGIIGVRKGFIVVNNIAISGNMTSQENDLLTNVLNSGVYIK